MAFNASQMKVLETKQRQWREHGMDDHEMLDAEALRRHVDSRLYCGGMLDHSGGHLHPLNLALGEAAALESLGGIVHEQSPVTHIENIDGEPVVHTAGGTVRPRQLVLCGNAYLGGVVPELETRIMPVSTQMVATEPLSESMASELLPSDSCVEDVRYILDYYRLSADRRLLFGGGTVYGGTDPHDVRAKLRPHLEKVFPQLRGIAIDHAWSGNFALSFSRVPQLGQLGRNTWFAMGYSGHGVTGSHLFGRIPGRGHRRRALPLRHLRRLALVPLSRRAAPARALFHRGFVVVRDARCGGTLDGPTTSGRFLQRWSGKG